MTIRKKLIFIQLLTAFAVLVLASAVFFLNEYRQFKADLVDNVSSIGLLIGENTASALVFMDNAAADQRHGEPVVPNHTSEQVHGLNPRGSWALYRHSDVSGRGWWVLVEPARGIEPRTYSLRVNRSSD